MGAGRAARDEGRDKRDQRGGERGEELGDNQLSESFFSKALRSVAGVLSFCRQRKPEISSDKLEEKKSALDVEVAKSRKEVDTLRKMEGELKKRYLENKDPVERERIIRDIGSNRGDIALQERWQNALEKERKVLQVHLMNRKMSERRGWIPDPVALEEARIAAEKNLEILENAYEPYARETSVRSPHEDAQLASIRAELEQMEREQVGSKVSEKQASKEIPSSTERRGDPLSRLERGARQESRPEAG